MPELTSLSSLQELRQRIIGGRAEAKPTIVVCAGTACQASESSRVIRRVKKHLLVNDLIDAVNLRVTGCLGFCEVGPFILTEPQGAFYTKLHHYQVPRIIDAVLADEYVEELLYQEPVSGKRCYHYEEIPFFKKQQRTLLSKNQKIDPIRFFNCISEGGYLALEKVLTNPDPDWIIREMIRSRLRGRGGAGFLTGKKWELARRQDGGLGKFVVCNADEGDPGAYMDRSILEGNPHSVIEGMIIGGIAMGATEGFIFVRHEYPLAVKHTIIGLRLAREYGLLGKNILGTGIDFDINIVKSAGAFVCGEETALIKTIEGFIGEPEQRPPYPIEKGIFGKPTCINNVETWANVPIILLEGADKYAAIGTPRSTGTKVFSLVGKIRNTGLVEVPMGITIEEIVYGIGGGPQDGCKIKAVQIGGPSGGCIPHWRFDLPIDYDSLTEAGAIMGSGGMIVMDENTCMVDVAKYFMNFLRDESCGKCFTCRKGTQRMYEILDDISRGHGTLEKLELLEELAQTVKDTTMCGLGQSAPNPVMSTLRYFLEEYRAHIVDRRCDAFVCKDLVGAPCQSGCPVGTEVWRYVAHIARGEYQQAYLAIRESNPFPSVCARVCDHKCEQRCRLGTTGQDPLAIRALKRFVTDNVDPGIYQPERTKELNGSQVAVVGAGPAGLTAAHLLSLKGYRVTLFDANSEPGGMLKIGIPSYRLPRDILDKEIASLLDDNITLKMGTALGIDVSVEGLFDSGFDAVFLGLGSMKSQALGLAGEEVEGVYPSMSFLREFNLDGRSLARGRVGVIGGGNSAIDAARIALRQEEVESVTVLYRRTREEMPAYDEEIDAAVEEGVELETLLSPAKIVSENEALTGVECIRNKLGDRDSSGRRRPIPIPGTEHTIKLDTLIVAIGEKPDIGGLFGKQSNSVETTSWGTLKVDPHTLTTGRAGLFAGGDIVTGPNTVVDAIAAGKKAALVIDRYLKGEVLHQPAASARPSVFVGAVAADADGSPRVRPRVPRIAVSDRLHSFAEVEKVMSAEAARAEASNCLRCDLEFTRPVEKTVAERSSGGQG
jgi:NADH-quinone oxidoreductase subunit F